MRSSWDNPWMSALFFVKGPSESATSNKNDANSPNKKQTVKPVKSHSHLCTSDEWTHWFVAAHRLDLNQLARHKTYDANLSIH